MSLETNFNAAPYFDDYNANSNYYRVLFKPSTAVQARELTQLQTILQDQIEKFGRHIFKDGSIVEGVSPVNYDSGIKYVKLQDLDSTGTAIQVNDYIGYKLVNLANLQAIIVNSIAGVEANDPDLNTVYVRYINSALYANGVQQKTYDPSESLFLKTLDDVAISNVSVAFSGFNPIGTGYALSTSEGVIFKNGVFIRVAPQTSIISKYNTTPSDIAVGFETAESVVTSETDSTLYDNAIGSPNFNAPGAARIKIVGTLTYRTSENTSTTSATSNTSNFFSVVKFQDGVPNLIHTDPQYARLGAELARRTYEESGNYIVDPFELTVTSNTSNVNNLVLEVDRGLGYVQGYRVEFADKNKVTMKKGIDTVYFPNQVITGNFGNFVYVNEVCGPIDTYNLDEVELYTIASGKLTARSYDISNISTGGLGTKIGTARARDIQYYSGTPGTPTAQYKLYLFDIKISGGNYSFADVKSIFAVSGTVPFFADTVLDTFNYAVIRESISRDMIFNIGQNALQTVNAIPTSFIFRANSTISFVSNGTATFTPPAVHAGGTNILALTGNLSESNESKFIIIPAANVNTINIASTSVSINTTSNAVIGNTTTFSTNFSVGDYIRAFNTSTNDFRRVTSIVNTTTITVDANFSFLNTTSNICRAFVAGIPISLLREDGANVMIANTTSGVINLGANLISTMSATLYYDSTRGSAAAASKVINKNRYVKIAANTHPNRNTGPWNIGISDVVKIRSIYQGTTYANTNSNYSNNFILNNGQKSGYYNHATIALNPGSGHSVGINDVLLVELDHFTPSYTSGIGYFSINSYPIDDANTANTSAIQTADIPVFNSDTGNIYDLRDSIDFRPYANNTANSATTIGNATVNPNTNLVFTIDSDGPYTITPDSNFNTAFTYYLGRKDKIALSPNGKVNIIGGAPSVSPVTPRDLDGTMTLGVVNIPPYPSLSQEDARLFSRFDYGCNIQLDQYRRYTMRDIGVIDKKLARLEYYTSLSLLEASAKTLIIKDDTGAERFKNGFVVDSFKGFTVGDTKNPEFKAAIDYKVQEMAPTIDRTYVKLDFNSNNSSNVTKTGDLIHLNGTSTPYITQSFASKTRNCVENIIYVWNGTVTIDPPGDLEPDLDVNPDVISNIDLSGLTNFINALPNIIGPERIVSTQTTGTTRTGTAATGITTTTTTNAIQNTIRNDIDFSASTVTNSFDFGELVQDVSIQFFMKARRVRFSATGLKPNTIVYPFFDSISVAARCTPADSSFVVTGAIGSTFITNANGRIYGVFDIPAETFKVGDRVFRLVDVDSLVTGSDSITTQASGSYMASNITVTKARYGLNTRIPQITSADREVLVNRNVTTVTTSITTPGTPVVVIPPPAPPRVDPIAQSFFIGDTGETVGAYINKVDMYFRTKHASFGVEVQVRYMENGAPTPKIVPFGRKFLNSNQVNTSSDSSTATTFTFDSPLFLESGKEYCFVVLPEGSNDGYNIWIGELGGNDLVTNTPIYVNNSTGVLFTSSTNTIWTPFQKEDIKFVIHRLNFTSTSGTMSFTNSNTEYLSVNNLLGKFTASEKVYVSNGTVVISSNTVTSNTSNAVSVVANGTSDAQAMFVNNSYIYISSNTGVITDVRYITSIPNSSHIVLNSALSFNDSNSSVGYLTGNGGLYGYASRVAPALGIMHLTESSANSTVGFTNATSTNTVLIGAESGARANLVSVDSVTYSVVVPQFSYIAPIGTSTIIKIRPHDGTSLDDVFTDVNSDIETFFTDKERKVKSRSQELAAGGDKTLFVSVPITASDFKVSPVLDTIKTNIVAIKNIINLNANTYGELNPHGGAAKAKYVSKKVALAEGQDAEDAIIYLSAYKPSNTDIKVYIKLLSVYDSDRLENKSWTLLNQNTSPAVVSSRVDRNDFHDFVYDVPIKYSINAASTTAMADYAIYGAFANTAVGSNNTISISNTTPLNSGELVYFIGASVATGIANGFYNVYFANTTTIQLSNTGSTAVTTITSAASANTGTLYYVPLTGFKDRNMSNNISYYTSSGANLPTYKTFAIKIVMTSDEGSHIVPRVSDMRAIALQL